MVAHELFPAGNLSGRLYQRIFFVSSSLWLVEFCIDSLQGKLTEVTNGEPEAAY